VAKSDLKIAPLENPYMEVNDGWTIGGPDGQTHKCRGTVVRFNYKHGTWSVQRPQRWETDRVGSVFTPQGEPSWLKAERELGFAPLAFGRSFSPNFVKLCEAGHALAEANATAANERLLAGPEDFGADLARQSFVEGALRLSGKTEEEARRTGAVDKADEQVESLFAPQYQTINAPATGDSSGLCG
jgi:hypothetical protein